MRLMFTSCICFMNAPKIGHYFWKGGIFSHFDKNPSTDSKIVRPEGHS